MNFKGAKEKLQRLVKEYEQHNKEKESKWIILMITTYLRKDLNIL
jgi:hypothetical protein